jgi:TolA-binding protein
MQERPDSALAIIRKLDTNTIRTPRYKARYALTKAIALDKNYIDTTDAGFLANAGRYYAKQGSKEDKMTYKYYLGRIQYNAGDFQNAAVSYMEALKYADDVDNVKLKGMIYGALGDTYSKSHNNKDQLKYELLAFETFEKYGDPSYLNFVRYKLATAYHNNREFDKSDSLLSTICDNDYLVKEATLVMADNEIHREPHNPARIVQLFESAIATKAHMDIYRYYQYAYALSESGRYNEANQLMSLLSRYPDNVKTYWWKYRINKLKRDTTDALKALETYCELSDSVVVAKLEQSVYKAQADHYALVSEIEKTNAQVSRLFVIITLLVSVIVLSALVIVFRGRKNRLIAEKEQLIL